jgi:hypothetical protein
MRTREGSKYGGRAMKKEEEVRKEEGAKGREGGKQRGIREKRSDRKGARKGGEKKGGREGGREVRGRGGDVMELNAEDQRVIPIPCPHRHSLHPQLLPSICVHLRCGFVWCIQVSVHGLVFKQKSARR